MKDKKQLLFSHLYYTSIFVFGFLPILDFLFNTLNLPKFEILTTPSLIKPDIIISKKKLSIIFSERSRGIPNYNIFHF